MQDARACTFHHYKDLSPGTAFRGTQVQVTLASFSDMKLHLQKIDDSFYTVMSCCRHLMPK